jgi:hypothetical protein
VLVKVRDYAVAIPAARATWDVGDAVLDGTDIESIPDGTGNGHHLVPETLGDATYNAEDEDFGGAPSAESDGGHFLHTVDAVDLSSFTLFLVMKPEASAGLFYYCYAVDGGEYVYASSSPGSFIHESVVGLAIARGMAETVGGAGSALEQDDLAHIYTIHYDGTADGSFVRIDGSIAAPDETPFSGDAGTGVWSKVLHILSDDAGDGDKPGTFAAGRLYPALTLAQIQAVENELRTAYPYKAPD